MVPFDVQTLEKFDATIQQVEAAIELFYAKRYAATITLAGAAEGCLPRVGGSFDEEAAGADTDLPGAEPLFQAMTRGAMEQYGMTKTEVIARFNAVRDWLKHDTACLPGRMDVTNYDAWAMIFRAVMRIEEMWPGSETPAIAGFIEFSRKHYSAILGR